MAIENIRKLTRRRLHRLREEPDGILTNGNGRRLHWRHENNGMAGVDRRVFLVAQEFESNGRFLVPADRGYGLTFFDIDAGHMTLDTQAERRGFTERLSVEEVVAFVASHRDRRESQRAAAMIQREQQL